MNVLVSILSATLSGSIVLQSWLAIRNQSTYGRFAELLFVLTYALVISTITFLVFVWPIFAFLQRTDSTLSVPATLILGFSIGLLVMAVFLGDWPTRYPLLFVAGGVAGAVEFLTYSTLRRRCVTDSALR